MTRLALLDEFDRIEKRRQEARIPQTKLAQAAGLSRSSYRAYVARTRTPQSGGLARLRRSLRQLEAVEEKDMAGRIAVCVFRAHVLALAAELDLDGPALLAVDPRDRTHPDFSNANHVRRLATYMTVTGLDVPSRYVARAAGVTKQAVSKWLPKVEDMRDDPAVDDLLDRVALTLGTETGW